MFDLFKKDWYLVYEDTFSAERYALPQKYRNEKTARKAAKTMYHQTKRQNEQLRDKIYLVSPDRKITLYSED
jgi:hypothetical protein